MISLPTLKIDLPEWKPSDFIRIKKNKEKIANLLVRTGKGSDKFLQACNRIRHLISTGRSHEIPTVIKTPVEVRALTYLFSQKEFHNHARITKGMLKSLHNPRPRLGLISLFQMIKVYFHYFDQVGSEEILNSICSLLSNELESRERYKSDDVISELKKNRSLLFRRDGPKQVVDYARKRNVHLDLVFKEFCLQDYHNSRFHQLCRYEYYLDTLKLLPVGEGHPVLDEVCKAEVYDAPAGEGLLLGHKVLEILIDRASSQEISDKWRGVIMTIAGDPRVPDTSARFRKWWSILGLDRQKKVRGWLSGFDLMLFLEALRNYGESEGKADLQRMFPARKIFLEGLYAQGLIHHSRLFIGSSPERYLKGSYKKEELPEYASLKDSYLSIIYLKVGNCHLIEGSHSARLWIFPRLPSDARITNYAKRRYQRTDLSTRIEKLYYEEYGYSAKSPISIRHYPDLSWQATAIRYLQSEGIRPDIEKLIEPRFYRKLKSWYGL